MLDAESRSLTVGETARLLGRSTEQVRRYLREGVLPGQRIGGQWFVARVDAENLLRRRDAALAPRIPAFDPDPLGPAIAIGRSGGGNIAAGKITYLRALRAEGRR
jgi:excisionase family DNA binding protein